MSDVQIDVQTVINSLTKQISDQAQRIAILEATLAAVTNAGAKAQAAAEESE